MTMQGERLEKDGVHMKKMLGTAALAVVIASPALAQPVAPPIYGQTVPHGHQQTPAEPYAQTPQGDYVATSRDEGLGGDYVGTDPDPNVRLELEKDAQERSH
jgi:opacity protein-like surface antigen